MAYTPINWQTGDTITAEKMNKMDNGWSVSSGGSAVLFSETVVTEDDEGAYTGNLTYAEPVPDGTLSVTFDGDDYTCECSYSEFGSVSGSFEDYPFYVFYVNSLGTLIQTATGGTHTISVTAEGGTTIETSEQFSLAVNNCIGTSPFLCVAEETTFDEMNTARSEGRLLYFYNHSGGVMHIIVSFANEESPTAVMALPEGVENVETYGFQDDGDGNLIFSISYY